MPGVFAFVCGLIACSPNEPDVIFLARPDWECSMPPTVAREAGTGADPNDSFVHLRWIIGGDPNLEGYHIYRRVHPETFDMLYATVLLTADQLLRPGEMIEWTDNGSQVGTLYFYVLFGFDRNGNRSPRSDTVGYQLLPKADLFPFRPPPSLKDTVTDPRPIFSFAPSQTVIELHTFVVRVASDSVNSRILWISPRVNPRQVTAGDPTYVQYGSEGLIVLPTLPPGRYRWRVDAQGIPRTTIEAPCRCISGPTGCSGTDSSLPTPDELSFFGSKSRWRTFVRVAP